MAQHITSSAFNRAEETEADDHAVTYLVNAGMDPEHFANMLFRLLVEESDLQKQLGWISTHPNTSDRASEVLDRGSIYEGTRHWEPDSAEWSMLRNSHTFQD